MTTKKTRIKHAPEFKAEALKLAGNVDVAAAALGEALRSLEQ